MENTASMFIQNFVTIFKSNKIESQSIKNAAFALARFFLLSEKDLNSRKVPPKLIDESHKLFIAFSNSNVDIMKELSEKFKDSNDRKTQVYYK